MTADTLRMIRYNLIPHAEVEQIGFIGGVRRSESGRSDCQEKVGYESHFLANATH